MSSLFRKNAGGGGTIKNNNALRFFVVTEQRTYIQCRGRGTYSYFVHLVRFSVVSSILRRTRPCVVSWTIDGCGSSTNHGTVNNALSHNKIVSFLRESIVTFCLPFLYFSARTPQSQTTVASLALVFIYKLLPLLSSVTCLTSDFPRIYWLLIIITESS